MNEQNPGALPIESTLPPAPYKDRSPGLIIFGILTILLGGMAGLLVLMSLAGQAMSARTTGAAPPVSAILPVISIYGAMAVALVWLGIGSIMARRWARALLLIFSWSWLIMGVVMVIFMALFMPKILATVSANGTSGHHAMPVAAMVGMMIGMFLVFGFLFLILPAIWTFFYHSRHVKATCEARDPVTRWTDACPLPVLGFCL
jgi:hypothetical protein